MRAAGVARAISSMPLHYVACNRIRAGPSADALPMDLARRRNGTEGVSIHQGRVGLRGGVGDACDLCNGDDDAGDTAGDGVCDDLDPCPADAADDSDGDGVCDNADNCPNDPEKTERGVCGCGVAETDSDGDRTPDCLDGCPNDAAKTVPGACGCGNAESDTCDCTPPPDAACGACAPGVFPVVGFVIPICVVGSRIRRFRARSRPGRPC